MLYFVLFKCLKYKLKTVHALPSQKQLVHSSALIGLARILSHICLSIGVIKLCNVSTHIFDQKSINFLLRSSIDEKRVESPVNFFSIASH